MTEFEHEIFNCLKMFGPCDLQTIQTKLDMRGIIKSQNEIETACESLLERKLIREATGFSNPAYKL